MKKIRPEIVEFLTPDGLTLPGLLYEASHKKAVVIHLHGNGTSSVFYSQKTNEIFARAYAKRGISVLFFNNRGANLIKRLTVRRGECEKRQPYGMAYEKIKECVPDIDGALAFLKGRGYRVLYLSGTSTGANKICVYHHYRPHNPIKKYVLICGGDDTGIYYQGLGKKKFWRLLALAKRRIKARRGDEILPELLPAFVFSAKGFYDIAHPDGDYNVFPFYELLGRARLSKKPLLRHFRAINKPSLVVYGSKDEYAWGAVPTLVDRLQRENPALNYLVIKGADHRFTKHEEELATHVAKWLSTNL